MRKFPLILFLVPVLSILILAAPSAFPDESNSRSSASEIWLKDIQVLDQLLRQHHPDPFFKTGEGTWLDGLSLARERVETGQSDAAIAAALMSAVARLGDGHTRLEPVAMDAFSWWLPLRFYQFEEGVFVTVALEDYADLVGQRLAGIGSAQVETIMGKLASAVAGDNMFMKREGTAALLSNAGLLSAMGLAADPSLPLAIHFDADDGSQTIRTVRTVKSWYSMNYRNWGELFGPPFEPFDAYRTPFHHGKAPMAYRDSPNGKDAPFFASRKPFWMRLSEDESVLTFQFNYFADIEDVSWNDFRKELWERLDRSQPRRLIIDLRFNFGGDGDMVRAFINELLARPAYANGNRLVVLTGRQTFSAAIMLMAELIDHTDAVFVGEPAGAPLNHFGDPESFLLPSERFELVVSTLFWQLGHPSDRQTLIPVNVCVPVSAHHYFSGVDSTWERAASLDLGKARSLTSRCSILSDE